MKIVKEDHCQICMIKPKCKCKLKVYKINNQHVTLCRKCLVENFVKNN